MNGVIIPRMSNKALMIVSVLCVLLAIICALLAFLLLSRPRFTLVSTTSPYIMFDDKTAQACWSGPPKPPPDNPPNTLPSGFRFDVVNQANLPFCKDLK